MKRAFLLLILLALAIVLPAQNTPLNITAPNGGEVWTIGSTYDITWTAMNLTGSVCLTLLGTNDPTGGTYQIAPAVPVNAGVFHWTIPDAVLPGINYKVHIASMPQGGAIFQDMSNGFFGITDGTDPPPPQTFITVTSPNGGEQWAAGSTQTITWNYSNLEGDVYIALISANSDQQIIIIPSTPIAAQSCQWTVPADIVPGHYKVHVVWLTVLAVYFGDMSDGFFFIGSGTPPPPQVIQVTAPNGGETWVAGTMHPITWNYSGVNGSVLIQLMGGPEMNPINIIANNIPASLGYFHWMIPPYQMPGNAYQVQVQMITADGVFIGDISDAPFSIMAGNVDPQSITVVSPNGDEQWLAGITYPITWTSTGLTGEVYIGLIAENMNSINIIAPVVPIDAQNFLWTIPEGTLPGRYMIQVVWLSDLTVYFGDISDNYFTINSSDPPPPQTLFLLTPNGGEVWITGFTYPISWVSATPEGFIDLTLLSINGPAASLINIAQGIPAAQLVYNWTIPGDVPAGQFYQMMVSQIAPDGTAAQDMSDAPFTIDTGDDPPPQTLAVTSPNGGEQWMRGETQTITWTDTEYTGNVRIFLMRGSANNGIHHRRRIAVNVPNTGSYAWTIPNTIPPGIRYKVAVKRIGGAADISDDFFSILTIETKIKASPNPTAQGTDISFEVETPQSASIRVYNVKGQCVRVLMEQQTLSGMQNIHWDGYDQSGRPVSNGIYFVRISAPEFNVSQKIIILK